MAKQQVLQLPRRVFSEIKAVVDSGKLITTNLSVLRAGTDYLHITVMPLPASKDPQPAPDRVLQKIEDGAYAGDEASRFKADALASANLTGHPRADDLYDYAVMKTGGDHAEVAQLLIEIGEFVTGGLSQ